MFDGDDGVGNAQRQVVMGMNPDLRCGQQCVAQGIDTLGDVAHRHGTTGVDDVHAARAVAFHQAGPLGQRRRGGQVAYHQEPDGVHAQPASRIEVPGGDVGFGAVRAHPHDAGAGAVRIAQVAHGADAGQQQGGAFRTGDSAGDGFDPFQIGVRGICRSRGADNRPH